MSLNRPAVKIESVLNEDGDITHCTIAIGEVTLDAPFTEASAELSERVMDATDVELNVTEVMAVTRASRAQLARELKRVEDVLREMPAGTLAKLPGQELTCWVDQEAGELRWVQYETFDKKPSGLSPSTIDCFGEIDTEELWEVADACRRWLKDRLCVTVDPAWLAEPGKPVASPRMN
ncbi:hypothetical protein VQ574_21530 (plasmid) [Stutzerimonas frequens]|uniref:hypothetical protein n=1 Tax=Stutzerimonas frequens TaxID=2968969 RepID=UPI002DB883CE|nr:hypothetical protein [Stutzerimonas frequens]WRW29309.1 hypothetical protein VQ574_21530 [Stutzerimonas frequens]